jgi:ribosomal protein S12 methylthiotransferase
MDAEILIVNTCGFIGPAKQESLQALRELADQKEPGQRLIAAGCLTQRYGAEIARQVPGIDAILGTRRWMDIGDVVERMLEQPPRKVLYHLPDVETVGEDAEGVRRVAIQGGSAYVKIADGCRRPCAFCAIPLIKGTAVSRSPEAILAEAAWLQEEGVREIVLIAQDTTDYGHDLGIEEGLGNLLSDLPLHAPRIDWIRVMYAYPGSVTDRMIEVMAEKEQILPYLDIPLQHAHPAVLRRMRRPANLDWVYRTIAKMRKAMPELVLRTTFIVGYPGESEAEFETMLECVQEVQFDRLGVFTFSFEPGTVSEELGDPIPADVKMQRREILMSIQQQISLEKNQALIGRTFNILIEGIGDGMSIGRTYRDAPEIDGMVVVNSECQIGEFVPVRITGASAYDLSGELIPAND